MDLTCSEQWVRHLFRLLNGSPSSLWLISRDSPSLWKWLDSICPKVPLENENTVYAYCSRHEAQNMCLGWRICRERGRMDLGGGRRKMLGEEEEKVLSKQQGLNVLTSADIRHQTSLACSCERKHMWHLKNYPVSISCDETFMFKWQDGRQPTKHLWCH